MSDINKAMVSKLAWTMLTKKESLWVRVLGSKNLRGKSFREVEVHATDSWIWKRIVKLGDVLDGRLCYKVGNGRDISALNDPWVPPIAGFKPVLCQTAQMEQEDIKVSDFIMSEVQRWDVAKVRSWFVPESADAVLNIRFPQEDTSDELF